MNMPRLTERREHLDRLRLSALIAKYIDGSITEPEKVEYLHLVADRQREIMGDMPRRVRHLVSLRKSFWER